jgi:hypothetical protein
MELSKRMTITVTTVYGDAAAVTGRPRDLPADADWPPPDGTVIIYPAMTPRGGSTSQACCSDCIRDEAKVDAARARWLRDYSASTFKGGVPFKVLSKGSNHNWHCTATPCRQYGSQLT